MKIEKNNQYLAVLLEEDSEFFLPGFKILNKQQGNGLLPCMRVYHNSRIKLFYRIGSCLSLEEWMRQGEKAQARKVVKGLVDTVINMKANGFLQASHVLWEPDLIFVDGNSYQTYMVVLPLEPERERQGEWYQTFVALLKKIAEQTGEPMEFLDIPGVSVEYIQRSLELEELSAGKKEKEAKKIPTLVLEYVEGDLLRQIKVDKEEFILGKSSEFADGVIYGISTVSRKHCKIIRSKDGYIVTDLGSLNGTYVNQIKVREGEQATLKPGDVLRLAKLDIRVTTGWEKEIG